MVDRKLAYSGLVFIAVVWGSTFPVIKTTLLYIDPISFLFLRFAVASLLLLPFIFRKISRRDAIFGSLTGVPLFLAYLTQTVGLDYTSPSMSGLITGVYVILTPILSILVLKKGFDAVKIYLTVASFIGIALMSVTSTSGQIAGNLLTLGAAFFIALQMVLTEKYLLKGDPMVFTFFQLLVVAALSLVASPESVMRVGAVANNYVLFSVLFNAVLSSALAIWIMSVAIKNTSAYLSALILVIEPFSAVLVSTIFFHFPVTVLMIVGGAIILVSMILAIRRENKKMIA